MRAGVHECSMRVARAARGSNEDRCDICHSQHFEFLKRFSFEQLEEQGAVLYTPYNNRECLHCHLGARSFEQGAVHTADPQTMPDIKSNKLSCVSSGCHDMVHNVSQLDHVKFWKPVQ